MNLPLYVIISFAYDLPFQSITPRLSGGPAWARSEHYDIEATAGTLPADMTAEARTRRRSRTLRTPRELVGPAAGGPHGAEWVV